MGGDDRRSRVLYIGVDNYPYPIPLALNASSRWYFNTAAGKDEILARRIGNNELLAIDAVCGMAKAEEVYFQSGHDGNPPNRYTNKIVSSPGKQDGLYSDASHADGAARNLVTKAFAAATGAGNAEPYHGYYFRVLKSQGPEATGGAFDYVVNGKMIGGFALVAWPAEYGVSGIQTFIINHEGLVYGKDLGMNTAALARQMTRFNPDRSWRRFDLE